MTKRTKAILDGLLDEAALAPCLWHVEVANAMLMAIRRDRLSPHQATRNIERIMKIPVIVEPPPNSVQILAIADLASVHGLTTYDALYLELAVRKGAVLATDDAALKRAARRIGVSLC